jgi:outer membrane protein TolC
MPIFSGGGQTAREGAAAARARQAQKSRDLAALEIEQDLRRAVQAFEFGRVQLESRQSAADYKRDQLKLLRQAYDEHARTLRELVEVQSEFTANELSAIASRYEFLSAGLKLYVLSGDSRTRQGR